MSSNTANIDALIGAERKRAAERIAKLKRAAAAEQRRIDEAVVGLLREHKPGLYERLESQAKDAMAADREKRSRRAKTAVSTSVVRSSSPKQMNEHERGEEAPWNR